jgi:hypothetical protein
MSKKRVFVSGDRQQLLYEYICQLRNRLAHDGAFNFDLMVEQGKDGKLTFVEAKHHEMSVEHILPRQFLIRGVSDYFAKPDDAPHVVMPEIGQKLLPFILPKKLRVAVAGDLAEDFRTLATQWGRPYALRWLWWELGGLCIRRFGPTAIITAVGMWFRQKLGW